MAHLTKEDKCFVEYATYVENLKFDEKPDYRYLQSLFNSSKISSVSET